MKDTLTDANFPKTADERVYHLGVRAGEVANRIITVGAPSRAQTIASFLDRSPPPFTLSSERGFLTITGRYKGTPISVVSIGMGYPNMDFFVREVRECLTGDMVVVRLGSCGALVDVPVGSVAIPEACMGVMRNFDFDYSQGHSQDLPYIFTKTVKADATLYSELSKAIDSAKPAGWRGSVVSGVNASADSFYSSQGRQTAFPDFNQNIIQHLRDTVPDIRTLEMETFHLYHLADCWTNRPQSAQNSHGPPLTTGPVKPVLSQVVGPDSQSPQKQPASSAIRAAAVQMIFAARTTQDFITPEAVTALEAWTGKAVLEALLSTPIPSENLHQEEGSVWAH